MNSICQSTGELVYTELLNSPAQIPKTLSNNFLCENSQSSESQLLVKYFLPDVNEGSQIPIDISTIITDRIDSECNGLPRDTFIVSLLEICQNDVDTLEQLRLYYFKCAKSRSDFPYVSAVLKRRVNPKTNNGESLVHKLSRDCYALRLASRGEFCDELKDSLSSKSSSRTLSCVDGENQSSNLDIIIRDKLIQLESNVVELKASNAKSISCLTNKIDQLHLENKKLVCELNKHKDRNINIQTQLNIFRSKTTMLIDALSTLENTQKSICDKQSELVQYQKNDNVLICDTKQTLDNVKSMVQENDTRISNFQKKLDKTTKLSSETKQRLDSEIIRITNISDSRVSGLCNLKSKASILSEDLKETKSLMQGYKIQASSCSQSVTELRKRVHTLEKNSKSQASSKQKSYAVAAIEPPVTIRVDDMNDSYTQQKNNPCDGLLSTKTGLNQGSKPVNSMKGNNFNDTDRIQHELSDCRSYNSHDKSTDNRHVAEDEHGTELSDEKDEHNKIPVYFPRSVCNPSNHLFKGVVQKKVSRFYIGGIDKRRASEERMREYLAERNIRVTFIRYFEKPYRNMASAQLNVASEDAQIVSDPEFWPEGIFSKPWLSWQQFANEHSITIKKRNGY